MDAPRFVKYVHVVLAASALFLVGSQALAQTQPQTQAKTTKVKVQSTAPTAMMQATHRTNNQDRWAAAARHANRRAAELKKRQAGVK